MSNILFAQPIFAPNDALLEKNLASIESLGNYLNAYPADISVAFSGYAKTDAAWDKIQFLVRNHFKQKCVYLTRLNKNCGKAYTVNSIVTASLKNQKYILTADSDIVFDRNCPDMMNRLLMICEYLEHSNKIGVVALDFKEANVHGASCYQNSFKFTNKFGQEEHLVFPHEPKGIAGGCWFTTAECWRAVNGYRVMGVYASDDACYLQDLANKGFSWHLVNSIYVIHPHEHDQRYALWKLNMAVNTPTVEKASIEDDVQRAEDFWK